MPQNTNNNSQQPNMQTLLDEFLNSIQNARTMLEEIISLQAWTVDGHASFTDWWLAEIKPQLHVTKEVAYTAAAQMML